MIPDETAIDKALETAPQPVSDFIVGGHLANAVVAIAHEHQLHVDTIGTLAELSRNMLLGLSSPAETLGELIVAGVDTATAQTVLADLNVKVFMPVRDAVKTGTNPFALDRDTDETPEVRTAAVAPTPAPASSARPSSPPLVPPLELVERPVPAPIVPPVSVSRPVEVPVPNVVAPNVAASGLPDEAVRTMASDMQAVKEHRTPTPIVPSVVIPTTQVQTIAAPPLPPTPPRTAPPPANLPGAAAVKPYSVDPYREPIE